ncbi:MAG: hypothetical protein RL011_2015 [Pseudomonadota bacterium]
MQNYSQPVVFRSQHKPRFFEIDPYGHLSMVHYAAYFVEHRFQGMAQHCGLNAEALAELDIAFFCANLNIEFKRPVLLDTEFTIESHIASYRGSTASVRCSMYDLGGKLLACCHMEIACVDIKRGRPKRLPDSVIKCFFHDAIADNHQGVAYSA